MLKHSLHSKILLLAAAATLSGALLGQEPLVLQTARPPEKVDSSAVNGQTDKLVDKEFTRVIALKHVKANWIVMNIQQLFKKQKDQFSMIGDEGQVVVRGNSQIIDEIVEVIDSIDRPAEPRVAPKLNPQTAGIGLGKELTDSESPEGRVRLKDALRKEFEQNQNQLRELLLDLSTRVKAAQELLERRNQLADEIIDLRFDEITTAKTSGEPQPAADLRPSEEVLQPSIPPE